MVRESLFRLSSFEMTLHRGDDQEKGNSKSMMVEDILSSSSRPLNMLVLLKRRHPERTGDHRAHLEI